jgi:dihydroxy-acid dehydratase
MLRAFGLGDPDFQKPQIGVAATWNKVTPCNAGLDVLRQAAAEQLNGRGVVAYEFDTISVSDGMSMGSEGMRASLVSRDWITDSIELVMRAWCYDGLLGIAGVRQIRSRRVARHCTPRSSGSVCVWRNTSLQGDALREFASISCA